MKIAIICVFLLTGCATLSPEQAAMRLADNERPIYCQQGEDCEIKWAKAINWLRKESHWSIRTSSDSLLSTYGPDRDFTNASYEITKTAARSGQYKIIWRGSCGGIYDCIPPLLDQRASFASYVMGYAVQ